MLRLLEYRSRILTARRRLELPGVRRRMWVLDVGSGGQPNPRADICCDGYEADSERLLPLKVDRPFVWADVTRLPFKAQAFDYVICSHVLEHVDEPERLFGELQRVGKAGYIETPSAASEFIIPYAYHVSRCTVIDGTLVVTKKPRWDDGLDEAYSDVQHDLRRLWLAMQGVDARMALTRFWWRTTIPYEIRAAARHAAKPSDAPPSVIVKGSLPRRLATRLAYLWLRPRKPCRLEDFLACPDCHGELTPATDLLRCSRCGRRFRRHLGHWDFRTPVD